MVAAKKMAEAKIGCPLVHGGGDTVQSSNMIGLHSETDLVQQGLAQGLVLSDTTVVQVVAAPLQNIPIGSKK